MNAKGYLETVSVLEERVSNLLRQQCVLRELACACTDELEKLGRVTQAQNLGERMLEAYDLLEKQKKRVEYTISHLPWEEERLVLSLHYVMNLRFSDIAEMMDYCERQVYRIHLRGLGHLEALVDC